MVPSRVVFAKAKSRENIFAAIQGPCEAWAEKTTLAAERPRPTASPSPASGMRSGRRAPAASFMPLNGIFVPLMNSRGAVEELVQGCLVPYHAGSLHGFGVIVVVEAAGLAAEQALVARADAVDVDGVAALAAAVELLAGNGIAGGGNRRGRRPARGRQSAPPRSELLFMEISRDFSWMELRTAPQEVPACGAAAVGIAWRRAVGKAGPAVAT